VKKLRNLSLLFCLHIICFSSCKKNEANSDSEPQTPPDVTAPSYIFSRFDANGLFKLQRTLNYWNDPLQGPTETISNEAIASFKLTPFDSANIDIGDVSCQYKYLSYQTNGFYLVNGNAASTMIFNDTLGVFWSSLGNPSFGVPGINYTTSKPMPAYLGVANNSMPNSLSRNLGFQIPLGANLKNADSVFVSVTVGQKSVKKTIGASTSFCSFSNSELGSLSASNGKSALLQVAPINYDVTLAGARKIYLANITAYTKFVEVK